MSVNLPHVPYHNNMLQVTNAMAVTIGELTAAISELGSEVICLIQGSRAEVVIAMRRRSDMALFEMKQQSASASHLIMEEMGVKFESA